jgi:hypothetical protein
MPMSRTIHHPTVDRWLMDHAATGNAPSARRTSSVAAALKHAAARPLRASARTPARPSPFWPSAADGARLRM